MPIPQVKMMACDSVTQEDSHLLDVIDGFHHFHEEDPSMFVTPSD